MLDLINVVEALYVDERDDVRWLEGVVDALGPAVDRGLGLVAMHVELTADGPRIKKVARSRGAPADYPELVVSVTARLGSAEGARLFTRSVVSTASRLLGRRAYTQHPASQQMLQPRGIHDVIGVLAADGSNESILLGILTPTLNDLSRRDTARLSRIAAHLAAAVRLRKATEATTAEAFVAPDGRMLDATADTAKAPSAREALRDFAVRVDRARSSQRTDDPDGALDLWRALADARWSLVERFDSDGRRYYVAHHNDPAPLGPAALSLRERQVAALLGLGHSRKLIQYELGLSAAAIHQHIYAACSKLGVRSAAELSLVVRATNVGPGAPPSATPT